MENLEDSKTRFSNRVENYAKYRPHYPLKVLEIIKDLVGDTRQITIADVGAGTGIFTELLLDLDATVYAVEPNDAMRSYAEKTLRNNKQGIYKSVRGSSDNTELDDHSVDLITVAQAFHWFEPKATKQEFLRILKDSGYLLLIWNDRVIEDSGFTNEFEHCLKELCPEYTDVTHKNITSIELTDFFHPFSYQTIELDNYQMFDYEGLIGRVMSSSYVPIHDKTVMAQMTARLQDLFTTYQQDSQVLFPYKTTIFMGRLK